MENLISKELLSEVLEINNINLILANENEINYTQYASMSRGTIDNYINIYELSHKCKEYLLDEGYYIVIHPFKVELFEKDTKDFIRDFHYPIQNKSIPYDFKRVIQSCQWVLDNKESK